MRSQVRFLTNPKSVPTRSGVSLIEVIVSMLIMSIGVVLVATLLPISILRVAQASQLTNAVFLKNNVEAMLEFAPSVLGSSKYIYAPGGVYQSLISSYNDGIPFASNTEGSLAGGIVDPLGCQLGLAANFSNGSALFSTGAVIPRVTGMGFLFAGAPNSGPLTVSPSSSAMSSIALQLAQLPDSWADVGQGSISANLSASPPYLTWADSSPAPVIGAGVSYRIVMTNSLTGQSTIVPLKSMTNISTGVSTNVPLPAASPPISVSGMQLFWWSGANGYAPSFTPTQVRIQAQQRRFTCLLTALKVLTPSGSNDQSWSADVDVVVFFNRPFSANDEVPYSTVLTSNSNGNTGFDGLPGVAGVDDNNNGNVDESGEVGWTGSDDNRTVTVTFTAGSQPFLKKGGFLLEPAQLRWYRIINLTTVTPVSTWATLLLDQDLRFASTVSQGIFMKGIVDVYPLGQINGQQ
jgi:prepilin-type N-terminal cleavage/methylation domain-containing protein